MSISKFAVLLIPTLVLPALAACADTFSSDAAEMLTPAQIANVNTTCTGVMHLKSWQQEFNGCVSSLSQTVGYQIRSGVMRQSYSDCLGAGFKRGTPAYGDCVLDRRDTHEAGLRQQVFDAQGTSVGVAGTEAIHNTSGSFFDGGFAGQRRKEEHACAAVNLEPGSAPFAQCVADLDTTIFNIEHPLG